MAFDSSATRLFRADISHDGTPNHFRYWQILSKNVAVKAMC